MVSKLKELSEDDLEDISNFLSETIEKKIQASVKSQLKLIQMSCPTYLMKESMK